MRAVGMGMLLAAVPAIMPGQALPTAGRSATLMAFGGVSGVYTGLDNGRNLQVTAGGDFDFISFRSLRFGVDLRGSYPVDKGSVVGEENLQGGVRVSRPVWRVAPYADVLFGRGQQDYGAKGYPAADGSSLYYTLSNGTLLSFGGGVDLPVSRTWSVRGDVQLERYKVPVTTSGTLNSTALTAALVYHFHFR